MNISLVFRITLPSNLLWQYYKLAIVGIINSTIAGSLPSIHICNATTFATTPVFPPALLCISCSRRSARKTPDSELRARWSTVSVMMMERRAPCSSLALSDYFHLVQTSLFLLFSLHHFLRNTCISSSL